MKKALSLLLALGLLFEVSDAVAQGVGIGTSDFVPTSDAVLELRSTTSGLLMPRMTQAQRNAIATPTEGVVIYQTDGTKGYYFYNGLAWIPQGTDNLGNHVAEQKLVMDDNIIANASGSQGLRLNNDGNLGVGTADPAERLQVEGNINLTNGATRTISVANEPSTSTNVPAKALTFKAASAASDDMGYPQRGGDLTLQAGNGFTSTVANNHGGHVIIRSGANHLNSATQKNGGDIIFQTGGVSGAITEQVRITDLGNVGIGLGVATPVAKLDVDGNVRLRGMSGVGSRAVVTNATGVLSTQDISVNNWGISGNTGLTASTSAIGVAANNNFFGTRTNTGLVFATNNLERMRIAANGNIGIGITNPAQKFQMADGNIRLSRSGGTAGELQFQSSNGSGYTTVKSGAQGATNMNYTLPTALPPAGTVRVLSSDVGGNMSWINPPFQIGNTLALHMTANVTDLDVTNVGAIYLTGTNNFEIRGTVGAVEKQVIYLINRTTNRNIKLKSGPGTQKFRNDEDVKANESGDIIFFDGTEWYVVSHH